MAFLCKQPLLLLFAKTRQSRNKTQNIYLSVAISANGRSWDLSCCIVHWNSTAMLLRGIYYTSASLFDAWPPSALLMAPFCCAAPIIQGVPSNLKYQNKEKKLLSQRRALHWKFLEKSSSLLQLVFFLVLKIGRNSWKNTLYMTQCKIEFTHASHWVS